MSPDQARALIRVVRTSAATKATYRVAEPLYQLACQKAQLQAWRPTNFALETFAGYLKGSSAFAAPAVYWWVVVESACDCGFYCRFDKKWADDVATALERCPPLHEQAAPLTVPVLPQLGAAAAMLVNFVLVLSPVAAWLSVARANCFLHLRPNDIQDVYVDRVRVVLRRLKGETRKQIPDPVFRAFRTPLQPRSSSPSTRPWVPFCYVQLQSFSSFMQRLGLSPGCMLGAAEPASPPPKKRKKGMGGGPHCQWPVDRHGTRTLFRANEHAHEVRLLYRERRLGLSCAHVRVQTRRTGMACGIAWPPIPSSAAHDIGLVLVHGAPRVALSWAEQARLYSGHIGALVPRRWQRPSPRFRQFLLRYRAEIADCVPRFNTQVSMHGSCWTLSVIKEQYSDHHRELMGGSGSKRTPRMIVLCRGTHASGLVAVGTVALEIRKSGPHVAPLLAYSLLACLLDPPPPPQTN